MNLCLCGVLIGLNNTMFRAKQDNNVVPFNNSYDLFKEVYNEQVDSLYAFVLKKVKNPELAQDIVQDTFLKFWDNRNALNPEANLQAYLFTIAHHLIIDMFRKEVKEITIDQYVSLYGAINENKTADSDILYKDVLQYVESSKTKLPSRACERQGNDDKRNITKPQFVSTNSEKLSYNSIESVEKRTHQRWFYLLVTFFLI